MLKEGLNTNNLDDLSGQRLRPSLLSDLWVLAKARVVSLLVFTAAVGEILAPNALVHWESALAGLVGIALAGG
ncbi:protoheme IX farnesyltransferase, partial [Acidithiobacillus ferriphilus]|nr:protoheme IX farnesyltransferase [Acidithiobacillus ferriphilus]